MFGILESEKQAVQADAQRRFALAGLPPPQLTDAQLRAAVMEKRRQDARRSRCRAVNAAAASRRVELKAAARKSAATSEKRGGQPVQQVVVPSQESTRSAAVDRELFRRSAPEMLWAFDHAAALEKRAATSASGLPPWVVETETDSESAVDSPAWHAAASARRRFDDIDNGAAHDDYYVDGDGAAHDDDYVDGDVDRNAAAWGVESAVGAAVNVDGDGGDHGAADNVDGDGDGSARAAARTYRPPGGGYRKRFSVSPSTHNQYTKARRRYERWVNLHGAGESDRSMADYITETFNTVASARFFCAATLHHHQCIGSVNPAGQLVDGALRAVQYRQGAAARESARDKRAGLLKREFRLMVDACLRENTVKSLRDAALLSFMFDGLLRRGEACHMQFVDIEFGGSESLTLYQTKTNQGGKPVTVYVNRKSIALARRWKRRAGIADDGFIIRSIDRHGNIGKRITPRAIDRIVKERAAAVGIRKPVSGHSLRIGSAQSMAAKGIPILDIQTAGRWKNQSTVMRYVEGYLIGKASPVARALYSGRR